MASSYLGFTCTSTTYPAGGLTDLSVSPYQIQGVYADNNLLYLDPFGNTTVLVCDDGIQPISVTGTAFTSSDYQELSMAIILLFVTALGIKMLRGIFSESPSRN